MPKARIVRWYVLEVAPGMVGDVILCSPVLIQEILAIKNRYARVNRWVIALETTSRAKVRELIGY